MCGYIMTNYKMLFKGYLLLQFLNVIATSENPYKIHWCPQTHAKQNLIRTQLSIITALLIKPFTLILTSSGCP